MELLYVSEKERNNTTREDTRGSGGINIPMSPGIGGGFSFDIPQGIKELNLSFVNSSSQIANFSFTLTNSGDLKDIKDMPSVLIKGSNSKGSSTALSVDRLVDTHPINSGR